MMILVIVKFVIILVFAWKMNAQIEQSQNFSDGELDTAAGVGCNNDSWDDCGVAESGARLV